MVIEEITGSAGDPDTSAPAESAPDSGDRDSRIAALADQFTVAGSQLEEEIAAEESEGNQTPPTESGDGDPEAGKAPDAPAAAETDVNAPPGPELVEALKSYGFPPGAFKTTAEAENAIAVRDLQAYNENLKLQQYFASIAAGAGTAPPPAAPPPPAAVAPASAAAQPPAAATPPPAPVLTSKIDLAKLGITKDNYDASLVDALQQVVDQAGQAAEENAKLRDQFRSYEQYLVSQEQVAETQEFDRLFSSVPDEIATKYGKGTLSELDAQGKRDLIQQRNEVVEMVRLIEGLEIQANRPLRPGSREAFFKRALFALNAENAQAIARKQIAGTLSTRANAATARPVSRPRPKTGADAAVDFFDKHVQQFASDSEN